MKNWFNQFSRARRWLNNEIREGPSKTAVVPENIDAVSELIMQDSHVIYREIELYLGISPTNIHSILREQLAVKNFYSAIAQKRLLSIGA